MVSVVSIILISHFLATLLCTLVAGILLCFSIVVMPGIKALDAREYLQSFKVMDQVIQNNQPIFMFVWLGSTIALITLAWFGLQHFEGVWRVLILIVCGLHFLGVQLPTIKINIPLNNYLQKTELLGLSDGALVEIRSNFEARWNQSNVIRTACAITSAILLLALMILPSLE